jgi:hypothetical protein
LVYQYGVVPSLFKVNSLSVSEKIVLF